MVKVGDRIRLSSGKGPDRECVVTAVMGSMVRVRWSSAGETTVIPAPGTLTVVASSSARAPKKAVPKKAAAKTGAKIATTSKKGASKKSSTGAKRSSR
jgi:hypothetical protein